MVVTLIKAVKFARLGETILTSAYTYCRASKELSSRSEPVFVLCVHILLMIFW
jgi:hypothetical protein